jgi:hypothetical protein
MKTIDLSDLKAGDKAWSVSKGWVTINLFNSHNEFFVLVGDKWHIADGRNEDDDPHPTLFHSEQEFREYWGMESNTLTKREQFAMAAMQGLLANKDSRSTSCEFKVETSIEHADELLTKLNEKP